MCKIWNKKHSTRSIQFQPKLVIDGDLIPAVKTGDSFRYLGRYFDFNMPNATYESEWYEILTEVLPSSLKLIFFLCIRKANLPSIIGIFSLNSPSTSPLPLLLKTWLCEHLHNVIAQYIFKLLDLRISAILSNIILPQTNYGLDIQLPSTKFIQCQTFLRNAIKNSQNEDMKELWRSTSNHTNTQHDLYRNAKSHAK